MGREIVKDYSQHACANQSSRLEEVHSCRTCAVWVHTDRSLKGLIGETAAHVSCLRAGDVSHCVYVESHHGCCWNGPGGAGKRIVPVRVAPQLPAIVASEQVA